MEKKHYVHPQISSEELQQQLLEANIRLSEEERMRTELFANLSHDLRAPMTALRSSVEYLKTGIPTPEEQQKILGIMENRVNFLSRLIDDMFLLAKMENRDTALQLEPVPLCAFLEEYFYNCQADESYSARNLELHLPESDAVISIDPQMMVRVMDNLFTNAKKYSHDGDSITLSAAVLGRTAQITVADTGIGMDEESASHVFERSYRGTRARTPGEDSSGLGLAIAQKILERHGGTIACKSQLGVGSQFVMTLPAQI